MLKLWKRVNNKFMAEIQIDDACLARVPQGDVSPDMSMVDENEVVELNKNANSQSTEEQDGEPQGFTGGLSLLRSNEEIKDAVPLSATVTIGTTSAGDLNCHEQAVQLLEHNNSNHSVTSNTSETGSNFGESERTYIVRPFSTFANDLDPDYLEKHYQIYFRMAERASARYEKYRFLDEPTSNTF